MTKILRCMLVLLSLNLAKACGGNGATKEIKATKGHIQGVVDYAMQQCKQQPKYSRIDLPCIVIPGQFVPGMGTDGISYVWIPAFSDSQKDVESYVEFEVEACVDTEINIAAKVLAPTSVDDSVFLKMDDEAKVAWSFGGGKDEWTWKTRKTPFKITAGKHKLRVLHREVRITIELPPT